MAKPLEIKDFSGGRTDNFFQGEPTRAEVLRNLLIGIDHRLSSRSGTLTQDNAKKAKRINSIESFNAFTDFVYSSEGHFYDIDGVEILGPVISPQIIGNEAFVGATEDATYTSAELNGQLILACDEVLQPQKIYRDSLNALQVKTVGLPKVTRAPISDASLLNECILAANILRTIFLNHIDSAENLDLERDGVSSSYSATTLQPVASTKAHWSVDKYAKRYFDGTVTFSPGQWKPTTLPTAAPAATDYDSLVALIEALNFAFEEHREDSAGFASVDLLTPSVGGVGPNRYHALGYQTQYTDGTYNYGFPIYAGQIDNHVKPTNQGIQQRITVSYNPDNAINISISENKVYRTKLIALAKFLDDFAVKFCLHETAPFVHRYNNKNSQATSALVSLAFEHQFLEPLLLETPVVIPTPFNFIYASNFIQRAFKNHILNTDVASSLDPTNYPTMHTLVNESLVSGLQPAGFYFATLPANPTIRQQYTAFYWDVIAAKINIFATRYSYFVHTSDLLFGVNQTNHTVQIALDPGTIPPGTPYTVVLSPAPVVTTLAGMALISAFNSKISQNIKKYSFNGITGQRANPPYINYIEVASTAIGYTAASVAVGTFIMHPYPLLSGQNTFLGGFKASTQYLESFGYAPDIYDLAGWISPMQTFYDAFKAHMADVNTHYHNTYPAYQEFYPTGAFGLGATVPAGTVQYYPISSLLPSVNLPGTQPLFRLPVAGRTAEETAANIAAAIKSYAYAFTYSDSYTTQADITFRVESAPTFTEAFNSEETLAVGVTSLMYGETDIYLTNQIITPVAMILGLTELTNSSTTNYAQAALNVYRTRGNGEEFFKINTLSATPLDRTPQGLPAVNLLGVYDLNSDIYSINGYPPLDDSNDILYTNGGISPSEQPTKSKYVWLANGYVYYGGVYDSDGVTFLPNRVVQSTQLAPDWVPAQNYVDFDAPVIGGGSARNVNVCLTKTGVFRLEGAFGTDGSGAIVKQQISNQIGGISGASIVVTEIGLFFAGTNGFYYTDGYQCIRISQELFKTYQVLSEVSEQKRQIKGVYDRTNRRVYWTVRSNSTKTDNDEIFVFDMNFGITPSGAFTNLSGGTGSWNPSALGYFENILFIGDTDGFLYYFDELTKTDPLKDILTAPNTWGTTYIPWEYRSTMMDFGGTAMRKFFSRVHHVGKNLGDVAIQYYITADNKTTQNLAPMRFIDTDGSGVIDQWRRVGGKKLRADLYQVGVKNGRFTVYNSDTYGGTPVFVSHVGNDTTITMTGAVLPTDSVGMSMCFASDYYATEYLIKSGTVVGTDTTLVLVDALNKVNSLLALAWEIRGYMKEQSFSLDALTIWFEEQGNLGTQYLGYSSSQGGGGNK
jgi:hypothetical protein